jgi:hypothetical protein
MEGLPAAPDLNLPDPDVRVNQLGMLVTPAEDESMRNDEHSTNQGKDMIRVTAFSSFQVHPVIALLTFQAGATATVFSVGSFNFSQPQTRSLNCIIFL